MAAMSSSTCLNTPRRMRCSLIFANHRSTCLAFVKNRLVDDDLGVIRAACSVAGRSGNKQFLKPLLEIIATENHEWLLREATDDANKLGAGFDMLNVWADRLR
jgi:hypothetical protein